MLIIKNKLIPFGKYIAINICGILFTKEELDEIAINHEAIHSKQIFEMLIVGFYLWYVIEYIIIRFCHKTQHGAYRDVSFEEEAYSNETNLDYIKTRKHYSWFKYVPRNSVNTTASK